MSGEVKNERKNCKVVDFTLGLLYHTLPKLYEAQKSGLIACA